MYDLPRHKERDPAVVADFVSRHPFAFLTGCGPDGAPVATQVPLLLEERDGRVLLQGHLMRGMDHHRAFAHNPNVLAVFTGAHTYVSARWYSDPHTPSTWNYMSVHARGTLRFVDEPALEAMLRKLTVHFEGGDATSPTTYDQLPTRMTARLLKAIVGFEIEVSGLDTVFKLSQDRDHASYLSIIEHLRGHGEAGAAIADEMQKRLPDVFPDAD